MPFAPTTRIPKRNRWISRPILGVSFTAVDRGWAHIENALNLVADHPQLCAVYAFQRTLYRAPRKLSQVSLFDAWYRDDNNLSRKRKISFPSETEPNRSCWRVRAKIWFKDSFNEQTFSHRMRSTRMIQVLPWFGQLLDVNYCSYYPELFVVFHIRS